MLKNIIRVLSVALLLLSAGYAAGYDHVTFPTDTLEIATASGKVKLTVELATDYRQQEFGLMFRKSMPQDHGMIFDVGNPRRIEMWMKNTYIPLDMIFINKDGMITRIVKNAKPLSTDIISSEGEVRAVLEINGGMADKDHVNTGDHVIYSIFR